MKKWLLKNFKRIWFSALAAMGLGWIVEMIAGIWIEGSVNGFIQLAIIIGGTIAGWFILDNNDDFEDEIDQFKNFHN